MHRKSFISFICLWAIIFSSTAHADCDRPSTTYERQDCNFKAERDFRRGNSAVDQKAREYLQSLKRNAEEEETQKRAQEAENARRKSEANALREAQAKRDREDQQQWERIASNLEKHAANDQGVEVLLREMAIRRLEAFLGKSLKAGAKGKMTKTDFETAISYAWPYPDLMKPWVDRAVAAHGGRFHLLSALVAWQGCPELDRFDLALNIIPGRKKKTCDARYHDEAVERLHQAMANASRYDRLMVCWLDLNWQQRKPLTRGEPENDEHRKRRKSLEDCRKQLADIPEHEANAFLTMNLGMPLAGYDEPSDFFVFFHPDRENISTADPMAMRRIILESRFHESWLTTIFPNIHLARERDAKALGVRYHWPMSEQELPIALGALSAKEIGFRGDKSLGILPVGTNVISPERNWYRLDRSAYRILEVVTAQREAGQYGLALRFSDMLIALLQQADGPDSGRISDALVNVGYSLEALKRPIEAERAFRRAVERRSILGNPDDIYLKNAQKHHGEFLARNNLPADGQFKPGDHLRTQEKPAPPVSTSSGLANKSIAGRYAAEGKNPDGSAYTAIVTIEKLSNGYRFIWDFGKTTMQGKGDFSSGKLVVDWGDNSPAIYTVAENGQLFGTWSNGKATEVLTPSK